MLNITPATIKALSEGDINNAIIASSKGGIENQEKEAQNQFNQNDEMPLEMKPNKEAFEEVGFVFGDAIDDLFVEAKLPEGWVKKASDHPMWTYILDNKGNQRVSIFYKGAFYDRRASALLEKNADE